jgi:CheY-like chemotaxis protein
VVHGPCQLGKLWLSRCQVGNTVAARPDRPENSRIAAFRTRRESDDRVRRDAHRVVTIEERALVERLLERQTAEKFRRALGASLSSPEGLGVLIVDDDEEIRLIAEYSVQQMGYRTLSAANAEEAMSIVKDSRPDIVLTDALMPKIDGRQLCRLIKAVDASIKVIIMSSLYKSSRYRVEALNTFRADEYLVKPINFEKLRISRLDGHMVRQGSAKLTPLGGTNS